MSKIVQILIKNTSTLDFSIPVLLELKKRGHEVILIDLCRKKNSLSSLYANLIKEYDIEYISREDLFPKTFQYILKFLDQIELRAAPVRLEEFLSAEKRISGILNFVFRNLGSIVFNILRISFYKYTSLLRGPASRLLALLDECDVILWDHRTSTSFYFNDYIVSHLKDYSGQIFLVPHAPHMRDPVTEIYLPVTGCLNENYNYLLPLNWSDNDVVYSSHEARFLHCGYPGFDESWRAEVESRSEQKHAGTVLILMRPFSDQSINDRSKIDHYVLSYTETVDWLLACKKQIGNDVERIHLKLHPSNSEKAVEDLLQEINFPVEVKILNEDIFMSVAKVDTVYGFYSTTLLIASAFGCKTYCMRTSLVERSFKDWPILEQVYHDYGIKFMHLRDDEKSPIKTTKNIKRHHFVANATEYCANVITGLS